jgi:hypothetical protein
MLPETEVLLGEREARLPQTERLLLVPDGARQLGTSFQLEVVLHP